MNILIADDHALVREALAYFITHETGHVVAKASDFHEAQGLVARNGPYDLVILDYVMPGMVGLSGLGAMLKAQKGRPVALISGNLPRRMVGLAYQHGVAGFISKASPPKSMLQAVEVMLKGERFFAPEPSSPDGAVLPSASLWPLSQREQVVMLHLCRGRTNIEISEDLGLPLTSVKSHVKSICQKIDARNRTHASIIGVEAGLFQVH